MTTDPEEILEGGPEGICAFCGHEESLHEFQDIELPGRTVARYICTGCDEEHEFVPSPD